MAEVLKIDNILKRLTVAGATGKPVVRNRIYRVGIELEGGWAKLPKGVELVHDGSIQGLSNIIIDGPAIPTPAAAAQPANPVIVTAGGRARGLAQDAIRQQAEFLRTMTAGRVAGEAAAVPAPNRLRLSVGEFPSEILEVPKFPTWMKQNYPSHVNDTCGMHVHMSFKKAFHYSRLMVPEYPQTIVVYLAKWAHEENLPKDHPIWPRLRGESQFCKLEFFPDEQARQSRKVYDRSMKGHRYTVINYCHAKTSTLECRLLPMMDTAEQGIRAVQRILDITNASLLALKGREAKESASLVIDAAIDAVEENKKIYV